MKVADEVWIGTALLHKEKKDRNSFTVKEIVQRVFDEFKKEPEWRLRPGVMVHVSLHCVANKSPNPNNLRYLVEPENEKGKRRLFKEVDPYHEWREGGKTKPNIEDLPLKYKKLL